MFYIGSSSVSKIENWYRGSVMSKAYRKLWLDEIRKNPMWGKVRLDSSIRMLMNNPMKSPLVSKKVAEKKAILYELGIHKSDRNSPESLKRSSERMCHRNPNKIRCCCIHCKKEVTPSSLTRFHKHKEKTCQ